MYLIDMHSSPTYRSGGLLLRKDKDKRVGVELIMVGDQQDEFYANMLSSVAFQIMDDNYCYYGDIYPDIISMYDSSCNTKHVILLTPAFWEKYSCYSSTEETICWLMLVPITDEEKHFIIKNGTESFEDLLSKQDSDITDRFRNSYS